MGSTVPNAGWMPVGLQNAVLPKTAVRAVAAANDIAIWRGENGAVRAWENRCPHRGMRLSYGIVRGNRLTCLYHGWSYDGEGGCAAIPAHPGLAPPKTIRAGIYQTAEIAGMIWVAPQDDAAPVPRIDGDWTPCRSLHLTKTELTLEAVLAEAGVSVETGYAEWAATVHLAEGGSRIALAVQPMGAHGAMLHAAIETLSPDGTAQVVSAWLGALRRRLERRAAA